MGFFSFRLLSAGSTVEDAQALLTFIHTSKVRRTAKNIHLPFSKDQVVTATSKVLCSHEQEAKPKGDDSFSM